MCGHRNNPGIFTFISRPLFDMRSLAAFLHGDKLRCEEKFKRVMKHADHIV